MTKVTGSSAPNAAQLAKQLQALEAKALNQVSTKEKQADAQIVALEKQVPSLKNDLEKVKTEIDHKFSLERSAIEAKFKMLEQEVGAPKDGGSHSSGGQANSGSHPSTGSKTSGSKTVATGKADHSKLPAQFRQWAPMIEASAKKYHLDPAYVAAVMDRETGGRNIRGDGGHGRGLMQIDDRSHAAWLHSHHEGMDPASNIDYGCSILRANLDAAGKHGLKGDAALRFAADAYNAGLGGALAGLKSGNPDSHTTGHNYGTDVLHRRAKFEAGFATTGGGKTGGGTKTGGGSKTGGGKSTGSTTYTVRSGDTLSSIAAHHGVSLAALEKANPQIKNPNVISVGEKIHIPGHGTTGGGKTGGGTKTGGTGGTHPAPGGTKGVKAFNAAKSVLGHNIQQLKYSGPLAKYLDKWPSSHVCCANFVCACQQAAGLMTASQHTDSVRALSDELSRNSSWKKVSLKDAKPGDVVIMNVPGEGAYGHTVMFAGWKDGRPEFIGSNNVNADGSQRITEEHMGYGITAIYQHK